MVERSQFIWKTMNWIWILVRGLITCSCYSVAVEEGLGNIGLVKKRPDLRDFISSLESQSPMLGNDMFSSAKIPHEGTKNRLDGSLDLTLSLSRQSSRESVQEIGLRSKNAAQKSTDNPRFDGHSWSHPAQPDIRIAFDPHDTLLSNIMNSAEGTSGQLSCTFANHHRKIPALYDRLKTFEDEEGNMPAPRKMETNCSPQGDTPSPLRHTVFVNIDGLETHPRRNEGSSAALNEKPCRPAKRKKMKGDPSSRCLEQGKEHPVALKNVEEPYPEEKENLSQLQQYPERRTLPFVFTNQWSQSYYENLHSQLYQVKEFVYGKQTRLIQYSDKTADYYRMLWELGTGNGRKELNTLGLPIHFDLCPKIGYGKKPMAEYSHQLMARLSIVKEWILNTLPQIIHDVRVLCRAFPQVILNSKMTVKQLQKNAWNFFYFFCDNMALIYVGSKKVSSWISKSLMDHGAIKGLIDKLSVKSLRYKGYSHSPGVSRALLVFWMSFNCQDLYLKSKGANGYPNTRFGALMNEFYEQ